MKTTEELLEIQKEVHKIATKHGWHEEKYTVGHWLGLVMSEVGEMINADRKNIHAKRFMFEKLTGDEFKMDFTAAFDTFIKDSVADEMADVIIRLFDVANEIHGDSMHWFGMRSSAYISGIDFPDKALYFVQNILNGSEVGLSDSVKFMFQWAADLEIDIDWHIKMKMKYNDLRPYKHGGKRY